MKNLLWLLTACFLFTVPFAAEAQFPPTPKSRPAAASQVAQAEVQASAPTSVQAAPPVINVAPSPIVVAAPSTLDEIKSWLNTTFLGLLTTIGGWIGFRGLKTATPSAGGPPAIVADVIAKFSDPATKQVLEAHGLQLALAAAQNPIVNTATQAGLSVVPGLGAAEPLIRSLGIKMLQDIIAKQGATP